MAEFPCLQSFLYPEPGTCWVLLPHLKKVIPKRSSQCNAWLVRPELCVLAILSPGWSTISFCMEAFPYGWTSALASSLTHTMLCSFSSVRKEVLKMQMHHRSTQEFNGILCYFIIISFLINAVSWDFLGAFFENWDKFSPVFFNQLIHFTGLMISTTKLSSFWTSYGNMAPVLCLHCQEQMWLWVY